MAGADIRILAVGHSVSVVTLSGEVDAATGLLLALALDDLRDRVVIVDLLDARNVGEETRDAIAAFAASATVTVVAPPLLLHAFELLETPVALEASLSAAVASSL